MKTLKGILIALAVCLVASVFLFKCNNPIKTWLQKNKVATAVKEDTKQVATIQYIVQHDTVVKYIDKTGTTHSVKTVASGDYRQLAIFYKGKFDSTAAELGINKKQLSDLIELQATLSGNIEAPIVQKDDFYEVVFADSFLHGYAIIDSNIAHMMLHYSGSFTLDGTIYWRRTHHFWFIRWGTPIYKSDFKTNSSNISIDKINTIKILKQ